MTQDSGAGGIDRFWPLVMPAAYAVHLAEETWGGPGFVDWMSTHFVADFSLGRFIWINSVAWPTMLAASIMAASAPRWRWLVVPMAVIITINGLLHLGSTLVAGSYSPGLISGIALYLPIGGYALRRVAREAPDPHFGRGVGLGVAIHLLVVALAAGLLF